ncbi:hypothetical protein BLA9940_04418 [Burkholderia aenigmatica]|nr:complement resistance protein TraT [Burkholderia aenigmatica]VWC75474.1 hypothetical protein BLA9940_04418 [Burkholderia aenigmatica]
MNFPISPIALAAMALALIVTLAFGVYWLVSRNRRQRLHHPAPAFPLHPRVDTHDEWEADAPYPDHVLRATADDSQEYVRRTGRRESFETPESSRLSDDARDVSPYASLQSRAHASTSTEPAIRCPHCLSSRIDTLNIGRKTGSTIGSVAGATSGMAMALSGAEAGAVVGAIGGPIGSVFGGLAGAVIAGLVGSAAGCAAGSAVGAAIDDNVLDNFRCRSCGNVFGSPPQ